MIANTRVIIIAMSHKTERRQKDRILKKFKQDWSLKSQVTNDFVRTLSSEQRGIKEATTAYK